MTGAWHGLLLLASAVVVTACQESGVVAQQRVPGGDATRGEHRLVAYGCGSCHVIPGVPAASGRVGPPLTDFADRTFVAGRLRNEPIALIAWIQHPQQVSPGTAMPDLGVTDADARDIAAYLYTLVARRLGPPHLFPERAIPGH